MGPRAYLLFNAKLASPTEVERTPREREATYASMRGWRGPRKLGSTYADPTKIDAARAMLAGGTGILKCQDCRAWHRHGASFEAGSRDLSSHRYRNLSYG